MLKRRVISVVLVYGGIVVQSINFKKYLPLGRPEIAIRYLNDWGIDEIILLDILASKKNGSPDISLIRDSVKNCLVPVTIGGGIRSLDHIHDLMQNGADKVALNQAALNDLDLVKQTAKKYGTQCVVASIDACISGRDYRVFNHVTRKVLVTTPWQHARILEEAGAGEILINSIEKDGIKQGFDFDLINRVKAAVKIPVIACGGAGNSGHIFEVFEKTDVDAVAVGNFFHFYEHSVTITKKHLSEKFSIRHDTNAKYLDTSLDDDFRIQKKDDIVLDNLLFEKVEKEII